MASRRLGWHTAGLSRWFHAVILYLMFQCALADPTWPSATDELEEIMYQLKAFKGRRFADTVWPCTNEASGPGRQNAAEWLRLGFHDTSTADAGAGTGGLDGSIQYMLDNGENLGPGFNTTLKFFSGYHSPRASISDLIAVGVYVSVRSCGGPAIPVRGGRVDAVVAGSMGVPQPQHDIALFRQQFARMGLTAEEMIQLTACGHTLGGVHSSEFPELISDDEVGTDSTVALFDNKVVTEYLDNNTTNPLVVGPAVALGKDSDRRIFGSDGNATVKAMVHPAEFQNVCQRVLQKMIEVVPKGVILSQPILPYMVKPVSLKLSLQPGATNMLLKGYIRVRTTHIDHKEIQDLGLTYRDRDGGNACGYCNVKLQGLGISNGLDERFTFFPIETTIPTRTGISSFTVTLNLKNGTSLRYDNNGHSYLVQDAVVLLRPQSCLMQHTGVIKVTAAVRNDRATLPITLRIFYKTHRPGLPVVGLHNMTISMRKGPCVGLYTLFTVQWTIPGGMSYESKIDIVSGDKNSPDIVVDDFNGAAKLPGDCAKFQGPAVCETIAVTPPAASVTRVENGTIIQPTTLSNVVAISTPGTTDVAHKTNTAEVTTATPQIGHQLKPSTATTSVFQDLLDYLVNLFFGSDRWRMVNNRAEQ